jgi:glycosyltransferase involved in cell wall biosynthesis
MKAKRICFFNSNKAWGGGEKWHLNAAMALANAGNRVFAGVNRESELARRLGPSFIEASITLSVSNLSFMNPFKLLCVVTFLRRHHIDAIVLNLPIDLKLAGIAAKLSGIQKIVFRRGMAVPVRDTLLNRYLYQRVVTHVIANSREIKRTILVHNPFICPADKLYVIYNGVDLNAFPSRPRKTANKVPVIGNAGRMVLQKGQTYLLKMAAELDRRGVDFKLVIGGKGALEEDLRQEAILLGIADKVVFCGFIEDMASFFRSIDIYVLPSLHEGTANTAIEAMAWYKPIVGFDISSTPELIVPNETGFLVPFADVLKLTDCVEVLCRDDDLRLQLGMKGRAVAEQRFDAKRNMRQVINLIETDGY